MTPTELQEYLVKLLSSGKNNKKSLSNIWFSFISADPCRAKRRMYDCTLHRDGEYLWRVALRGDDIIKINTSGDVVTGTFHNVERGMLVSKAERIHSALFLPTKNYKGRIFAKFYNSTIFVPLADNMSFAIWRGNVICTTPELATITKKRVVREKAKPINKFISELRKSTLVYLRMCVISAEETNNYLYAHRNLKNDLIRAYENWDGSAFDVETATKFWAWGALISSPYREPEKYTESAVRSLRNLLFTKYNVYEKYQVNAWR